MRSRTLVTPGSRVTVSFSDGRIISFIISSPFHNAALPRSGVVSLEAPISKALLGKKIGDRESYEAAGAIQIVTIIDIATTNTR